MGEKNLEINTDIEEGVMVDMDAELLSLVWSENWFVPGIIIGFTGIAGIAASYPLYRAITRRERKKLAPQILKLTEELSKPE